MTDRSSQAVAEARRLLTELQAWLGLAVVEVDAGIVERRVGKALAALDSVSGPEEQLAWKIAREQSAILERHGWTCVSQEYGVDWTHPDHGDKWFSTQGALSRVPAGGENLERLAEHAPDVLKDTGNEHLERGPAGGEQPADKDDR